MLLKPNPASTTLYSAPSEMESHMVRFIMAEKNIEREVLNVQMEKMPEEILELTPYQTFPILFDRGIVLYDLSVIIEYLDERFPFPPLLPIDPIKKSEKRLLLFRFTRAPDCWYSLVNTIQTGKKKESDEARKILSSSLIELIPLFDSQPYFSSDNMTIIDTCLAPLLWRLKHLGIKLGPKAQPITRYANKLFAKESFKASLTDCEKEYN